MKSPCLLAIIGLATFLGAVGACGNAETGDAADAGTPTDAAPDRAIRDAGKDADPRVADGPDADGADAGEADASTPNDAGPTADGGVVAVDGGVDAGLTTPGVQIFVGSFSSWARFPDGRLKGWGDATRGNLGSGNNSHRGDAPGEMGAAIPVLDVGAGRTVRSVGCGQFSVCAILDDQSLKCWGRNFEGQLGLGDLENRGDLPGEMGNALPAVDLGPGRVPVEVAGGGAFTCARFDDGAVKCWGNNNMGQLGLGDTQRRGDGIGAMGAALPTVNLGAGKRAIAIRTGFEHACALLDDGAVKCWGRNADGQLGLGDTAARGDGPGEMGDSLPAVDLGTGRRAIGLSAALATTCALLDDGTVKCWGKNAHGELGLGDIAARGDGPGEMGDLLPAVSLGANRRAVQVAAATLHTCARLDNNAVKCWGDGSLGQLGLGDTGVRGDGPGEMGDLLPSVPLGTGRFARFIATNNAHTCAILDDDSVKCWGYNRYGQLGLGDFFNRGDTPSGIGDALPPIALGL